MPSAPSVAVQIIVAIIPIVGIVMGSVLVFFYLFWSYKQRTLMIEKGILKKNPFDLDLFSLLSGFMLFGIGTCLTLFFYLEEGLSYSLLGGLIPLAIGLSLLLFFVVWRKLRHHHDHNVSELSSNGQIVG
jgi:uncharacterized membrane protein